MCLQFEETRRMTCSEGHLHASQLPLTLFLDASNTACWTTAGEGVGLAAGEVEPDEETPMCMSVRICENEAEGRGEVDSRRRF
jgi:hypothetical protein